jgi:hypothetical protein
MSDDPFTIPPIPMMSAEKARDVARAIQGLANHLTEIGVPTEAARFERTSQWWLTYSIALAQTRKPDKPAA